MINNFELSPWELLVYFITGILTLSIVTTHYLINEYYFFASDFMLKVPTSIYLFFTPFLILLFGLLVEPLANWIDKNVQIPIRTFFKLRTIKTVVKDYDAIKKVIEDEYFNDAIKKSDSSTYHLCKDHLLKNGLPSPFMAFLSQYGFYRNVAFLFYLSIICNFFIYTCNMNLIMINIILLILGAFYESRSISFFGHMTGLIYRYYLLENAK